MFNKVRDRELLVMNFSLGSEKKTLSVAQSTVQPEKAQEEHRETARCQLDQETSVHFCSDIGLFHERMINIQNKLWGSYFEAKSINEETPRFLSRGRQY